MSDIPISINGQEIGVRPKTTVLEAARALGIHIPTFCFVKGKSKAHCRICLVEVEGRDKPVRSCVTLARPGMVVHTDTAMVKELRKKNLETLAENHFGDCKAPCSMSCPGQINVQGYIAHIRLGQYEEALRLVMERNPLPFSVGRVCPRFCETNCRRALVDQPIAINHLKRFVADWCMANDKDVDLRIEKEPATGKRVAVIGGGPAGLSGAFFLAKYGHQVSILEGEAELGGMLRYGIPGYRIPKAVLDYEIKTILKLGIKVRCGQRWGRDFTLRSLQDEGFDAVLLGVGTQKAKIIDIPGIDLPFVHPATEFLKQVNEGKNHFPGRRAVVLGGTNIGMEAARSLVRLGVKEVIVVHSSSPDKMQAQEHSAKEAEREGVRFIPMASPTQIVERHGTLFLRMQRMELSEPDQGGRQRPVPVSGLTESLLTDLILYSVGQETLLATFPPESLEAKLESTSSGLLKVHGQSQKTSLGFVWAAGDAVSGPQSVIQAVVSGRRAAKYIHASIAQVEKEPAEPRFNFTRGQTFQEVDRFLIEGYTPQKREVMDRVEYEERITNFDEVRHGFSEKTARREADRCLSCGCTAFDRCDLRKYSIADGVDLNETGMGSIHLYDVNPRHPLFEVDLNKCIYCQRCKNNCEYDALDLTCEGLDQNCRPVGLKFSFNEKCVNCCNCVDACPTGALTKKDVIVPIINEPVRYVPTTCPYCGSGCHLILKIKGRTLMEVVTNNDKPPNYGMLCVKGRFALDFIRHPDRLTQPLVRKCGELVESSWEDALTLVAKRFKELRDRHGADSLAGFSCARASNEENFLMQKFMRAVIGTNNIDHCARLCHAPTVASLALTLGSGAMTNSIEDFRNEQPDVVLMIGSNPDTSHPMTGLRIRQAIRKGAKLIVIDPRGHKFARQADIWMQHNPGSDVALLNGLMHIIIKEDLWDKAYVAERTENFEELQIVTEKYTPAYVAGITGISMEKLHEAARLYASPGKKCAIVYGMGLAHWASGSDNVKSVSNLALLCGKIGAVGGGINPLRGQNNVQGACDMGALFNTLPGYAGLSRDDIFDKYEKLWGVTMPRKPGIPATEVWNNIVAGNIRGLYIFGEDPVLADPNARHAVNAIDKLDFLVVQDIFLTDTAKKADVVLPAACFAEKDGTFTCSERRVQRIRKAFNPPGQAKADWEIFCELARKMGYPMHYDSPKEIFTEICSLTPQYAGMSYERIDEVGLQWPCPDKDHPGTPVLHIGTFPRGRALFIPADYEPPKELPDDQYPVLLTTGRDVAQYNFGSMTRRTPSIERISPEALAEVHPADAARLGISEKSWIRLTSRRGEVKARATISDRVQVGTIFIPYHYAEVPINNLTMNHLDKLSRSPQYKACAIKIEVLG
ncbi:MAG: formate dehydrogenase subunit alpha [Deltaproteobacteria bacterium CG23_combo_of_CG06-09_8_20_14_all_60_8]|nr:MAG: formate dehydrogenase subunit alpha [Desulfobacterales bacterium CG2_30_60_27]PIP42919.1 MAG: formate dehydrogenase subunit alpha [Deltaproteobacteria bacterium CG23_combo_of_CG06-09_8_20_14_all_60_8]